MISVSEQTFLFLQSCLLGVFLGFLYDLFRILRIAVKPNVIISFIEDLIYFIICTIFCFTFVLLNADGKLRSFLIIGIVIGAVLYFHSISMLILALAKPVIAFLQKIVKGLFHVTMRPILLFIKFLNQQITKMVSLISRKQKRIKINRKNSLKTDIHMVYNQDTSIANKCEREKRRAKRQSKSKKK